MQLSFQTRMWGGSVVLTPKKRCRNKHEQFPVGCIWLLAKRILCPGGA